MSSINHLICCAFFFLLPSQSSLDLRYSAVTSLISWIPVPPTNLILTPLYTSSFLSIQTKSTSSNKKRNSQRIRRHRHYRWQMKGLPSLRQQQQQEEEKEHKKVQESRQKMIEVREGERITLKCKTGTTTKPETRIVWTRNGLPFRPTEGLDEKIEEDEEKPQTFSTESSLHLSVQLIDQGSRFKCSAQHPGLTEGHEVSDDVSISVLLPPANPEITGLNPDKKRVKVGDKVVLSCISRGGNPLANVVWYRDEEVVDESSSVTSLDSGVVATSNSYAFLVKPEDNRRVFRCVAWNVLAKLSSELRLDVHFPPVSIKINGPTVGKINDVLRYQCTVGPSNPVPKRVTWFINGIEQRDGVYPIETWQDEVSYGYTVRTNITILLSESIKTISCSALSSLFSDDLTTIDASIDVHVLCEYLFPCPLLLSLFSRLTYMSLSLFLTPETLISLLNRLNGSPFSVCFYLFVWFSLFSVCTHFSPGSPPPDFLFLSLRCFCLYHHKADCIASFFPLSILPDVWFCLFICSGADPPGEPTIIGYERGQEVREGDTLKLKCGSLGGYPLPSIRWTKVLASSKEEKNISAGIESGNGGQSGVSSDLYVQITESDNGATYRCSVMNEAITSPLTASVHLFPVYFMSPALRVIPHDKILVKSEPEIESESIVSCESGECYPSCNLTWYLNGYQIDRSIVTIRESSSSGENAGLKKFSRLQLVRSWNSEEDGSVLTCASSNNFLPNKRSSKNVSVQVLCKFPLTAWNLTQEIAGIRMWCFSFPRFLHHQFLLLTPWLVAPHSNSLLTLLVPSSHLHR